MIIKAVIDKKNPMHVHFRLFEGEQESSLGYCGKVCMSSKGWQLFQDIMAIGCMGNIDPVSQVRFIVSM